MYDSCIDQFAFGGDDVGVMPADLTLPQHFLVTIADCGSAVEHWRARSTEVQMTMTRFWVPFHVKADFKKN